MQRSKQTTSFRLASHGTRAKVCGLLLLLPVVFLQLTRLDGSSIYLAPKQIVSLQVDLPGYRKGTLITLDSGLVVVKETVCVVLAKVAIASAKETIEDKVK